MRQALGAQLCENSRQQLSNLKQKVISCKFVAGRAFADKKILMQTLTDNDLRLETKVTAVQSHRETRKSPTAFFRRWSWAFEVILRSKFCITCFCSPCPVIAKTLLASDAWVLGLLKWMTVPSFLIKLTSSIPGILLTASFFKVPCSFLSSVAAVWWTIFFLRRGVPERFNTIHKSVERAVFSAHAIIIRQLKTPNIDSGFSQFSPRQSIVLSTILTFSTDTNKLSLSLQLL